MFSGGCSKGHAIHKSDSQIGKATDKQLCVTPDGHWVSVMPMCNNHMPSLF